MPKFTQNMIQVGDTLTPCTIFRKREDGMLRVAYDRGTRHGLVECHSWVRPEQIIERTYSYGRDELDAQDRDWEQQHIDEIPC